MNKSLKTNLAIFTIGLGILASIPCNAKGEDILKKNRIYGQNRIETSVEISKIGWKNGSNSVVIASAYDFADALSAAPLARKNNGPILLNGKDVLPKNTISEIKRLNPKEVFILGGELVISKGVENQLNEIGIKDVKRIYGKNRYETSIKVAKELGDVKSAFITNGETYADALSISSIAATKGSPIIYTTKEKLNDNAREYIEKNNIDKIYCIGGEGVLSNNVLSSLENSKRLSGDNRYLTNMQVLKNFKEELNFENVYFVRGDDFADALSVAPMASKKNSVVVIADKEVIRDTEILVNSNITSESEVIAVGGENCIPEGILDKFISDFDILEIAMNKINLF
ncbi:cell wall-binding repeat-containing protein [Clostridium ihumii]|uniref:cell wall-binding repeat-containing protein n=1 Tax=Clostridium ihumii TaxID=1470356 RepID=UPI003D3548BF